MVSQLTKTWANQIAAANAGKRLGFAGKSRVGLSPRPGVRQHELANFLRAFSNCYTRTWGWNSVSVRRFLQVTGWQMDVGLQRSRE